MTLEEQIQIERQRNESAKARQDRALAAGNFSLQAWRQQSDIAQSWIRLEIEVDKHLMDKAERAHQLFKDQLATRNFQIEHNRLRAKRDEIEKKIKRANRTMEFASMVFLGRSIEFDNFVNCWRKLAKIADPTAKFPPTDGFGNFYRRRKKMWLPEKFTTQEMTIPRLCELLIKHRIMINPLSPAFESIVDVFKAAVERQNGHIAKAVERLDANQLRLDAINQGHWSKVGLG